MALFGAQSCREEAWRAKIPIQLKLVESDVSSMEQPPTLYFLVPRTSYLHTMVPAALRLLHRLLPPGELSPWFEAGRLPLKWNVPVGVLFDLLAPSPGVAPWRLTLHFRAYPCTMLAPWEGEPSLRAAFLNSLKEAAFVARGSVQRVMEMSAGAQADLWAAAADGRLAAYAQVVSSLQLDPVPRGGRPPCVPLRLFVRRGGRSAYLSSYEDISFTSRPVEAQAPDGAGVSLRQALLPLVAECLASAGGGSDVELEQGRASAVPTSSSSSIRVEVGGHEQRQEQQQAESGRDGSLPSMPGVVAGSGGSEAEGDGAAVGSPSVGTKAAAAVEAVGTNSEGGALAAAEAAITEVVVAGISPPLEAPLLWLHSQLASADQFLYIVVHCKD